MKRSPSIQNPPGLRHGMSPSQIRHLLRLHGDFSAAGSCPLSQVTFNFLVVYTYYKHWSGGSFLINTIWRWQPGINTQFCSHCIYTAHDDQSWIAGDTPSHYLLPGTLTCNHPLCHSDDDRRKAHCFLRPGQLRAVNFKKSSAPEIS